MGKKRRVFARVFEEGQGEVGIVVSLKVEDIEVAGGEVVVVCLQKLVHRAAFSAPIDGQKKTSRWARSSGA
jgi:hypothetical protein